jgi:uncharacterized protein YndB with AHSA1/START domain
VVTQTLAIRHWVGADPETVWNAYVTPELFHRFFAPDGLSIPLESVVIEPRVGGRFECVMVFDETGEESPNIGRIAEWDPPHRFVGTENIGEGFRSTWSFGSDAGGTLVTVVQEGLPAEVVGDPAVLEAFRSSYRKLGRLLGVATENR